MHLLKGNCGAKFSHFFIAFLSSYGCINKADKVLLPQVKSPWSYGLSKTIVYISSLSGRSLAMTLIVVLVQSIYYAISVVLRSCGRKDTI